MFRFSEEFNPLVVGLRLIRQSWTDLKDLLRDFHGGMNSSKENLSFGSKKLPLNDSIE